MSGRVASRAIVVGTVAEGRRAGLLCMRGRWVVSLGGVSLSGCYRVDVSCRCWFQLCWGRELRGGGVGEGRDRLWTSRLRLEFGWVGGGVEWWYWRGGGATAD